VALFTQVLASESAAENVIDRHEAPIGHAGVAAYELHRSSPSDQVRDPVIAVTVDRGDE
jgi:hypothetical protein